jgi:glycosyltransferase involved in cell wall biosynthesis
MVILHIITSLGHGGTQNALVRLIKATSGEYEHHVISLTGDCYYESRLLDLGVKVNVLGINTWYRGIQSLSILYKYIKHTQPDLIHTWLYHSDLIGGVIGRLATNAPIIWSIRGTKVQKGLVKLQTRIIVRVNSFLSYLIPKKIVSCAEASSEEHIKLGYCKRKILVIPNGLDLREWKKELVESLKYRKIWSQNNNAIVFGVVARWDPNKGFDILFDALRQLADEKKNWSCVLVGEGLDDANEKLQMDLRGNGIRGRVITEGPIQNIKAVMSALDFLVLSSASEGFPNVLVEAMACGTPCISTTVGDASYIIGKTGWLVPPKNSKKLAVTIQAAMEAKIHSAEWNKRKKDCVKRISDNFNLSIMVNAYQNLWKSINV